MKLEEQLDEYFPNLGDETFVYFIVVILSQQMFKISNLGQEKKWLIELQHDDLPHGIYKREESVQFRFCVQNYHKRIAVSDIRALLLLPLTRVFESIFLVLLVIETKQKSVLKTFEYDLRSTVARVSSCISELVAKTASSISLTLSFSLKLKIIKI